jgi:hypothetical protein
MASYYVCTSITALSAFTSFGFSLHALLLAKNKQTSALYAASRSVALALVSLIPIFYHSKPFLTAIAIVMIIVQLVDAAIGFKIKSLLKTYGPMMTAIFNLLALIWLLN